VDDRPYRENELLDTMACINLLVLCASVKLLTIFREGKLSKYFSKGSMENG